MIATGELQEIYRYPLSGGQADGLDEATVLLTGIEGDRRFVAYDPYSYIEGHGPRRNASAWYPGIHERISQRQYPQFAQIAAMYGAYGELVLSHEREGELVVPSDITHTNRGPVSIAEFGDCTQALDVGHEAEVYLKLVTGVGARDGMRLARKTQRWMTTTNQQEVLNRSVRPLHIIAAASLASLQAEGIDRGMRPFGADRFRPNFVVEDLGDDPNELIGEVLQVGSLHVGITDVTRRCPVPGFDQKTGENRKDIPTLYPTLHRAAVKPAKPVFGVYGVPLRQGQNTKSIVQVGDAVRIGTR